jgi:transposase InsO family protein
MPLRILTDQGPEFEGQLFSELCQLMDIHKLRTTPYKPSTNAVVERVHKTIIQCWLNAFVQIRGTDANTSLPLWQHTGHRVMNLLVRVQIA